MHKVLRPVTTYYRGLIRETGNRTNNKFRDVDLLVFVMTEISTARIFIFFSITRRCTCIISYVISYSSTEPWCRIRDRIYTRVRLFAGRAGFAVTLNTDVRNKLNSQIKESFEESQALRERFHNDLEAFRKNAESRLAERNRRAKKQQVPYHVHIVHITFPCRALENCTNNIYTCQRAAHEAGSLVDSHA